MLEVRKNTYSRSYENSFFREFAREMSKSFKDSGRTGLLIGSPLCVHEERLQIDALLITEQAVCIIDFKNFGGQINIPNEKNFELGIWTNFDGEQIKGGSSINPFIQLKNQKRRFNEVFKKYISKNIAKGDRLDCTHIVSIVCFQKEISLIKEIPASKELAFWVIDKINFVEKINDIIDVTDKDIYLTENSYNAFKEAFRADIFKIDDKPLEDKLKDFAEKSETLDFSILQPDQKAALTEIKSFLENPDEKVFTLQGTTNTGKSFLIPYIQDIAFKIGIQETEVFASSSRVANNLMSSIGIDKINSIYAYIYGGKKSEITEDEEKNPELEEESIQLESVPLKSCDNSDNALFIVDEAQLVSDSFHQSLDLIFGSGYVLKDFIRFSDLKNSKRKIIFIGDPYQLHIGKADETPLNPSYLEEAYELSTNAYQLFDKPEFSFVNKQALVCVEGIRNQSFNSLKFYESNSFHFLKRESFKEKVTELIEKRNGHLLYFSNDDSQKTNLWIKEKILANGTDIAKGDLVYFSNNISIEDENDPNSTPKRIFNGQFANVNNVSDNVITESIFTKKGELIATINFREIQLKISETGNEAGVISFENYRLNPKAELSKNELRAYKIFLYQLAEKEVKNFEDGKYKADEELSSLFIDLKNGKRVKGKINLKVQSLLRSMPATLFYKFKNAALLRFGWAMTVYKSMSYKWNEIVFNVDPGENVGKTNQQHFKWLYTGISRAKQKVSLINYKSISPFDETEIFDNNTLVNQNEFFYIAESTEQTEKLRELNEFVNSKIYGKAIQIERIENLNWQERYHFNKNNEPAVLSFSYNSHGRFRNPKLTGGNNDVGNDIIKVIMRPTDSFNFDIIKDKWRKLSYEGLANTLSILNIRFIQVIQTKYKDKIKLIDEQNELDVEVDYNSDGAYTKITAKYYSSPSIWETFKDSINKQIG